MPVGGATVSGPEHKPTARGSDACRGSNSLWTRTLGRYTRAGLPECVVSTMSAPPPKATHERTHKGHTPNPRTEINIPDPAGNRTRAAGLEGTVLTTPPFCERDSGGLFHCGVTSEQSSFSNLSVTSPTSQLILQSFRRFTYVTARSPTLQLLYLRHSSFSNPSFASPSQALHLRHLASWPCISPTLITKFSQNIVADAERNKALTDCHKCSFHSFLLSNPTLLKSLPVSWKRSEQVAVSSYSS